MLQIKTIEPRTLSLLRKLMEIPELDKFCLVGGTALALKHGHRTSIDLDLFATEKFDNNLIINALNSVFKENIFIQKNINIGIFCQIYGIKVDIIYYPHPLVAEIEIIENIRFYNDKDIAAMKIQAILGRAEKKDFWDLYELLKQFNVSQIIEYHKLKFSNQFLAITIPQAITYFEDAEISPDPKSFKSQTWEKIKAGINKKVREFIFQ